MMAPLRPAPMMRISATWFLPRGAVPRHDCSHYRDCILRYLNRSMLYIVAATKGLTLRPSVGWAENILAVDQHIAEVDADAVEDASGLGNAGVALGHLLLNPDCAFDRRDDGWKFQQRAVAHRLDEPPAESANDRRRRLAVLAHRARRARFVFAHHPGVAHHVGGKDRGELPGLAHSSGSPALRRPSNTAGRLGECSFIHLTVIARLRRRASASSAFASSILPASA